MSYTDELININSLRIFLFDPGFLYFIAERVRFADWGWALPALSSWNSEWKHNFVTSLFLNYLQNVKYLPNLISLVAVCPIVSFEEPISSTGIMIAASTLTRIFGFWKNLLG